MADEEPTYMGDGCAAHSRAATWAQDDRVAVQPEDGRTCVLRDVLVDEQSLDAGSGIDGVSAVSSGERCGGDN